MAEFRKLPTQAELQNMLFMEQMRVKNPQQIAQEALASGTTVTPIPENVFQKIAGGAGIAKEYVNRAGSAADLAKLFPGYKPETRVNIPTGYNFAPKQAPTGEVIPGGLQTQNVNLGQVLGAIKPADVLGISGAERAYTDVGLGKAPQPLDVLDVAGLGATGLVGGKAALRATRGMPVGMSIQEAKGLLTEAPRSPLGFYSALEESALNLQRNKGSGQAFLNDLQKAPNVKADEIKWTGLDEFLKTKPNVTKQEVQDYLANNRVDVEEVMLGNVRNQALQKEQFAASQLVNLINSQEGSSIRLANTQEKVFSDEALYALQDGTSVPEQFPPEFQLAAKNYLAAHNAAKRVVDDMPTKFGHYTLPGGENYREILLTMPDKGTTKQAEEFARQMYEKYGTPTFRSLMTPDELAKFDNLNNTVQQYSSAHFPQKNILAHLRVNDRVDADGKKMLLIEEVQSDWHQAGREKGYAGAESKAAESAFRQYSKELADKYNLNPEQNLSMYATLKRMQPEEVAKYEQLQSAWTASKGGVPDAPFKDSWYQLALKRAIQYAAENGYDRIGLTTGSQQAARFDLSKQLSRVSYQDGVLHGYDKSGALVMNKAVTPDDLPNYVGKELGSKMAENAAKDAEIRNKISVARYERKPESEIDALRSQLDGVKTDYAGLDLQVGGEGMKKYYDEIYPKFLDKYGKKWGARVGETTINLQRDLEGFMPRKDMQIEPVRYLDVTPEMKASVSKGQPLFQALPAIPATGLLATQDENR